MRVCPTPRIQSQPRISRFCVRQSPNDEHPPKARVQDKPMPRLRIPRAMGPEGTSSEHSSVMYPLLFLTFDVRPVVSAIGKSCSDLGGGCSSVVEEKSGRGWRGTSAGFFVPTWVPGSTLGVLTVSLVRGARVSIRWFILTFHRTDSVSLNVVFQPSNCWNGRSVPPARIPVQTSPGVYAIRMCQRPG